MQSSGDLQALKLQHKVFEKYYDNLLSHHSPFRISLLCAQRCAQSSHGKEEGKKKEESKPHVLSNSHFPTSRHKEIKHANENYIPNIALIFVASKKFFQQVMLLTISSQGMHNWSRTDLTWQRNWKEKRHELLQWQYLIHLDGERISRALAVRFYCRALCIVVHFALLCTATHTSCVSAWSHLKGDMCQGHSVQFVKDLWILWEKRQYTFSTQCQAAAVTLHSMQQKSNQEFFCQDQLQAMKMPAVKAKEESLILFLLLIYFNLDLPASHKSFFF